jgi:hypothetical protein
VLSKSEEAAALVLTHRGQIEGFSQQPLGFAMQAQKIVPLEHEAVLFYGIRAPAKQIERFPELKVRNG